MRLTRRWQILAALVLLFGAARFSLSPESIVPERLSFDRFPRELGAYRGYHVPVSNEALRVLDLTDHLSRNYVSDGSLINVYVGFHQSQRRGRVIHSPAHCLPANGWYIVRREQVPLPGGPDDLLINRMEVAYQNDSQIVYYWYQGRGRIVASEYLAALYRSLDAVRHHRTDEALVRFATADDGEQSEADLRRFIERFVPLLDPYLPG